MSRLRSALAILALAVSALAAVEQAPATEPAFGWRCDRSGVFPDTQPALEWSPTRNVVWHATIGAEEPAPARP